MHSVLLLKRSSSEEGRAIEVCDTHSPNTAPCPYREAVVLAGGFGTRLASHVPQTPKPMAPVSGRPFLRFVLDTLFEEGFDSVVLAVGYRHQDIEDYFGSCYKGMRLVYSVEETPLGTGGGIRQALTLCRSDIVIVLHGDSLFHCDYQQMIELLTHDSSIDMALAVKELCDFDRFGTVEFDKNLRINSFREKASCRQGFINGGVYALRREALEDTPETFSFEKDYLEVRSDTLHIQAAPSQGFFIDIGIPEDYELAQDLFKTMIDIRPIAFFDRDGTINIDTGHPHRVEELELITPTIKLIKKYKEQGYYCVVVTNQAGIAKGLYGEEDMRLFNCELNRQLLTFGASIDAFYFCPHHPDFSGECDCRKPKPGMIKKALFDFEADPKQCILFGDKESDLEASQACGIEAILIG